MCRAYGKCARTLSEIATIPDDDPNRGWVRTTGDEVLDIRAVGMAWIDIVVSDKRAREVLGYEPLVSREECMREATAWCEATYASYSQKKLE